MKGFIEVSDSNRKVTMLINVSHIISIAPIAANPEFTTISFAVGGVTTHKKYEDVKKLIEQSLS